MDRSNAAISFDQVGISLVLTTCVVLVVFDVCLAFASNWISSAPDDWASMNSADRFFPKKNMQGWLISWFMLFSGAAVAVSSSTCALWATKLRLIALCDATGPYLSPTEAIAFVLLLHAILCAVLTWETGGPRVSPFPAGLLTVPTLGIFLQISNRHAFWLACVCLTAYLTMHMLSDRSNMDRNAGATVFLNSACFILSIGTAFAAMQITQ
jgi:hypothetical protein